MLDKARELGLRCLRDRAPPADSDAYSANDAVVRSAPRKTLDQLLKVANPFLKCVAGRAWELALRRRPGICGLKTLAKSRI